MNPFLKIWSYFLPVKLKTYYSKYSSALEIVVEDGKKVLNTQKVNYSFNSLHRIFKEAFKLTNLSIPNQSNILILGLGGGSIASIIRNEYKSKAPITAIEIDPTVIDIAINEFGIKNWGEPITIVNEDAFKYVQTLNQQFNVICIDLFIHDEVPDLFLTPSFLTQVISALKPKGAIYFNFMDNTSEKTNRLNDLINFLNNKMEVVIQILKLEENNRLLVITK